MNPKDFTTPGTRYLAKASAPKKSKVPRALSPGEEAFALHCRAEKLNPVREFIFHHTRKWRFDFYFPEQRLAVEIEGGLRAGGRHQRIAGFTDDAEKYNQATSMGIRVLRYTPAMVLAGTAIDEVLKVLGQEPL